MDDGSSDGDFVLLQASLGELLELQRRAAPAGLHGPTARGAGRLPWATTLLRPGSPGPSGCTSLT